MTELAYEINIQNVTKRYDDKLAVDNININIKEGEIFGLLGPNGAGKSTLISMICGLIPMDKGDISVGGYSIKKNPKMVKSFIGYVPQEIAIFENLSIMDNLKYFGRMYGLRSVMLKSRIEEILKVTGLEERKKDKVQKLSGGMKRRLNIACAVLHKPKILIMDEPTVGIDPQSRNHILEFTRKMNQDNKTTIIYTSHYMEEIEKLCSKIMILDLGKEILSGTKEEIIRSFIDEITLEITTSSIINEEIVPLMMLTGIKKVDWDKNVIKLIAKSSEYKIEDVFKTLRDLNIGIKNLNIIEPDLETAFLIVTGKKLRD